MMLLLLCQNLIKIYKDFIRYQIKNLPHKQIPMKQIYIKIY
jgi:hypothetical protein